MGARTGAGGEHDHGRGLVTVVGRGRAESPFAEPATAAELGLMAGSPPQADSRVTVRSWQEGPNNRWAFQHVSELVPSAVLGRGEGPVLELPRAERDLGDIPLADLACGATSLDTFLRASATDGFIVLHQGSIVYERYLNGMRPDTRHVLMSVSKSMCGMLAGRFVESGALDLDARTTVYVPELWSSAYADATISQLLDMTASVEFDEDYDSPHSHVQAQDRVAGWRPRRLDDAADGYSFLRSLLGGPGHGRSFQYCSATTDVIAWVLERATGRRYTELLTSHLWTQLGAEHDALVTVDSSGFAFANGGVSTSLRDLARFGLLVLRGGTMGPHSIASDAWVARTRAGGDVRVMQGTDFARAYPRGSYRNQWWVIDDACLYGTGIYGQFVWLDLAADAVIVKLSSLPEALDLPIVRDHHIAFRRLTAALA